MDKELKKRIDQANDKMVVEASQEPAGGQEQAKPIDYYQAQLNAAYEASQSPVQHGSPASLSRVVDNMVDEFKQTTYNVTKNQYDHLTEYGAVDMAESFRQRYLVNDFLPLVESVVENYSVDSLLNNRNALAKLDEVAITPNGAGDGFTKAYLKQMHKGQANSAPSESDIEVRWQLSKAENMASSGDIRGGVSLAKKIKDKVDSGELSASEEDYRTLARVSAYK